MHRSKTHGKFELTHRLWLTGQTLESPFSNKPASIL
jgi:hypothetical protein